MPSVSPSRPNPSPGAATPSPGRGRSAIARHRGVAMHAFVFAVVAIDLLALNLLTNRDTLWAVWPIGVWAIVLAAHAGATTIKPSAFGAHLAGGGAICLGLAIVNIFHGGTPWAIWPTLAWLLTLALHAPFAFEHLRDRRRPGR